MIVLVDDPLSLMPLLSHIKIPIMCLEHALQAPIVDRVLLQYYNKI